MGYLAIGTYIDEHELKMIKTLFVHNKLSINMCRVCILQIFFKS